MNKLLLVLVRSSSLSGNYWIKISRTPTYSIVYVGSDYRGDPKELLDIESVLTDLKEEIRVKLFKDAIEKLFIQIITEQY